MKTQINTIVNGCKISIGAVSPNGGTNVNVRRELFTKVLAENPNEIRLKIDGFECVLKHETSTTGKSHYYIGVAPLDLWKKWEGNNCLSANREDECGITLGSDCTLTAYITTSKSSYYANIQNDLVEVI